MDADTARRRRRWESSRREISCVTPSQPTDLFLSLPPPKSQKLFLSLFNLEIFFCETRKSRVFDWCVVITHFFSVLFSNLNSILVNPNIVNLTSLLRRLLQFIYRIEEKARRAKK